MYTKSEMIALAALVLVATSNTVCNGFRISPAQLKNHRLQRFHKSSSTVLQAVPPKSDEALEKETVRGQNPSDETTLTFRGEFSVSSNVLPKTSVEGVLEFFRRPDHRDLLMTGGRDKPCSEVKVTPDLLNDWKDRCSALGACQPDESDSILSIISEGIQFPGLKVESNALIGAKYVEFVERDTQKLDDRAEESLNPRYEFVLLATEQIASGLAPAVWIFRKLTGADKKDSDENSKFESISTVTYEETEDGKIFFRTDALLSIGVTFPKLLLKILPGDKKTIEEKGSKSIMKTLDKDVSQSMKSFEDAYLESFN